jgi:predicted nucleotide-binding protein
VSDEKASKKSVEMKEEKVKAVRLKQTDVPAHTLEEALRVPKAIWDDCGGKPTAPFNLAKTLGLSPNSSTWRYLSGASVAYGFTSGAYNSAEVSLSELGKKLVSSENYSKEILLQALLLPSLMNAFFSEYNGSKLPKMNIIETKLMSLGVPKEKTQEVYEIIIKNADFVGIIVETKGGNFIHLDSVKNSSTPSQSAVAKKMPEANDVEDDEDSELPEEFLEKMNISKEPNKREQVIVAEAVKPQAKPKVFITHGKNHVMVEQLKELLKFGQFEPIVEIEHESTAIPVPAKVFSGMRGCQAGIIHITEEQVLLDAQGNEHRIINENVLIEIGAALALYQNKVILLCQKDITLPSNLQGLYKCEYEGEQLDYTATMKLLKTFNEFR